MAKNKTLLSLVFSLVFLTCFGQHQLRTELQQVYTSEIGVREASGRNDGARVETFLRYVKLGKGNPWCAAFVCWSLNQVKIKNPRSGWSPALFPVGSVIYQPSARKKQPPQSGDVFGIWFASKKRIAHVGFVDSWGTNYCTTVEGNTNEAGSREGDGVYRKKRLIRQIYAVSSYIK